MANDQNQTLFMQHFLFLNCFIINKLQYMANDQNQTLFMQHLQHVTINFGKLCTCRHETLKHVDKPSQTLMPLVYYPHDNAMHTQLYNKSVFSLLDCVVHFTDTCKYS